MWRPYFFVRDQWHYSVVTDACPLHCLIETTNECADANAKYQVDSATFRNSPIYQDFIRTLAGERRRLNSEVGEGFCLSTVAQPIVRRAGSKLASHFN